MLKKLLKHIKYRRIFKECSDFTMIPRYLFIENLDLINNYDLPENGNIVECGVWKGGMAAGIAILLGNQYEYHLFDSFEGLPDAQEVDGQNAIDWQKDTMSDQYYDNCSADISFAKKIMDTTGVNHSIHKGWFEDTLSKFRQEDTKGISLLRMDADWYESTMTILRELYPLVKTKGLIIIDDYQAWDGCSKAVHDYLSEIQSKSRILQSGNITYIVKMDGYE